MNHIRSILLVLMCLAASLLHAEKGGCTHQAEALSSLTEGMPSIGKIAVVIPITLISDIPLAKLVLNRNQDAYFVIDSGFPKTILDQESAKQSGVRISATSTGLIKGTGDSPGQLMYSASSIRLGFGNHLLFNGAAPATSLSSLSRNLGIHLSGILGYDILRYRPTVVDYANCRMIIYRGKKLKATPAGVVTLKVNPASAIPLIRANISIGSTDLETSRVLLDTGSEWAVEIDPSFSKSHSLQRFKGWTRETGTGIGGGNPVLDGLTGSLGLGEHHNIQVDDVALSLSTEGLVKDRPYDFLIGGPIFHGASIIFDVGDGLIYLHLPN